MVSPLKEERVLNGVLVTVTKLGFPVAFAIFISIWLFFVYIPKQEAIMHGQIMDCQGLLRSTAQSLLSLEQNLQKLVERMNNYQLSSRRE